MKPILNSGPSLCIGIPTLGRPVPLDWALSFKSLNPPINYNTVIQLIRGQEVASARNAIGEFAIEKGCKYLFFLGDDVVVPNHTLRSLIYRLEQDPTIAVAGGVYCAKAEPCFPLVFRGLGNGSYWDWKIGEFFEVDALGMDCTLIRVSILEKMPKPWFKTISDDKFLDGVNEAAEWTEDLYFFNKLNELGLGKVYCDGGIICQHHDVYGNKSYGLPKDSLPMRQKVVAKDRRLLMIGPSIEISDHNFDITTFGPENADYRGQISVLPFAEGEFDWIIVSDPGFQTDTKEWMRCIKPGGKLTIRFSPMFCNTRLMDAIPNSTINGEFLEIIKSVNGSLQLNGLSLSATN